MHHHLGMHVVDPKILLAAVTQGAHSIFGALLGLVFGHAALGRQAVEMHQDAMRRLHRLANAVLALAQEHGPLRRHEHADQHRHGGHGKPHQHHQTPRHAEFEQKVHGQPPEPKGTGQLRNQPTTHALPPNGMTSHRSTLRFLMHLGNTRHIVVRIRTL